MDSLPVPVQLYHKLQNITKLLRILQLIITVTFILYLSTHLHLSAPYLRRLSSLLLSPPSVFLLGNAIVLSLLFSSPSPSPSVTVDDVISDLYHHTTTTTTPPPLEQVDDVIFQDKEIICEQVVAVKPSLKIKRSQSEKVSEEESKEKLRRSETEICRRNVFSGEDIPMNDEDDLSNEEFQRTIEEFIAKQIRFHRQERLSVVLHGQA